MSCTFPMSPSKRKLMENWLFKVDQCLEERSICTNVISIIDHDPHDAEVAVRPLDDIISGTERPKSRQRRDLKTSESKDETDYRSNTLPNVKYKNSYAEELKRKSRQLLEGMNVMKNVEQTRKNYVIADASKEVTRNAAMVIVDPQLITPTTDLNSIAPIMKSRAKLEEKDEKNSKYESLKAQMQARRLATKEIFERCKVQSHDKDSFVISRSNIKIKDNDKKEISNHSFLALPLRFQLDTNRKRVLSRERVNNVPGNSNLEHVDTTTRRIEASNPKLLQSAVWAW